MALKANKHRVAARVRTGSAKGGATVAAVRRDNQGRFASSKSAPHASASAPLNRAGRRQAAKASRAVTRGQVSHSSQRGGAS